MAELKEFVEEQKSKVAREKEGKAVAGDDSGGEGEGESDLAQRKRRRIAPRRDDPKRFKIGTVINSLKLADVSMVRAGVVCCGQGLGLHIPWPFPP